MASHPPPHPGSPPPNPDALASSAAPAAASPKHDPLAESCTDIRAPQQRHPRADVVPRPDWQLPAHPKLAQLPTTRRHLLARYWSEQALARHADAAHYGQLALRMLTLAAPLEFVAAAQQASQDKVRHCQWLMGLASAYAGQSLGPGALPESHAPQDSAALLVQTIADGCIGETLRAMQSDSAARFCQDQPLQPVLRQLASDERRHAALAWRLSRWLLQTDPSLLDVAQQAFERAEQCPFKKANAPAHQWLTAYGCLSDAQRADLDRATLHEVVEPCKTSLLSEFVQSGALAGNGGT